MGSDQHTGKETRPRILFMMRNLIMGGVERVLCRYMATLQEMGAAKCTLLSLAPLSEQWLLSFLQEQGIAYIDHLIDAPADKTAFFLKQWLHKARLHRQKKALPSKLAAILDEYDVLVDFTLGCAPFIRTADKPKIGWLHGSFLTFDGSPERLALLEGYEKIVCLSDACLGDLTATYPQLASTFVRIYNPLDADHVRREAERPASIAAEAPYFIAVQRLANDKSVGTIIRAFESFHRRHPEYRLYIVGDGYLREPLRAMTHCPNIIFTGQIDNPYPLIKDAQALILSSTLKYGEGLPTVLLEAQALRTLCISSDVPSGPAEILLHGKAGYLFEAENPESLCATLCRAVEAPAEAEEMVRLGAENLSRFLPETSARAFLSLLPRRAHVYVL